jgi:hypothetical protein
MWWYADEPQNEPELETSEEIAEDDLARFWVDEEEGDV